MLANARARLDDDLADRPLLAATVKHQLGASFLAVGASADAAEVLTEALDTRREQLGDHTDTLRSAVLLGEATMLLGRFPEAVAIFEDAVEIANRAMYCLEAENRIRAEIRDGHSTLAQVADLYKWEKKIVGRE